MLASNSGSEARIGNSRSCQPPPPSSSFSSPSSIPISSPLISHLQFNNTDLVYSLDEEPRIPLVCCSDKFVLNALARMMKTIEPQRRVIGACSRNCTTNNFVITDDFKCYSHNVMSRHATHSSNHPNSCNNHNGFFDITNGLGNACHSLRVYQAAAGYNHTALLVDRLYVRKVNEGVLTTTDDHPHEHNQNKCNNTSSIHSSSYPSATKYHTLPNGECFAVPESCSIVCLFSSVCNFTESILVGGSHAVNIRTGQMIQTSHDAKSIALNRDLIWLTSLEQELEANEYVTFLTSAAFTIVAITNRGRLLGIGSNDLGDLGLPKIVVQQRTFKRIPSPPNEFFVKACCGDHNIAALTRDGKLYVTGCNYTNEIGVSESCCYGLTHCKCVDTHLSDPIIDIACEYYKIYMLKKSNTLWTVQDGKAVRIVFSKQFLSSFPYPPNIKIECLSTTASSIQVIAHVTCASRSYRFLMSNSLDRDLIINAISDISSIYHSSNEYTNPTHSQHYQLCSTAYLGFFFWKPKYHVKPEDLFKKQLVTQTYSPNSRHLCDLFVLCREW